MSELQSIDKRTIKITCDCRLWTHVVKAESDGKLSLESFAEKQIIKPKKRETSIFDFADADEDEGTS